MAKNTPAWKIMGLDGPPPVVRGFHHYGTVWTAEDGPQRESLRHAWDTATWSWSYWGRKVRLSIEHARTEGPGRPLTAHIMDRVALTLVWALTRLHRPKG